MQFLEGLCDFAAVQKAVSNGHEINEVEAAGNTPLHCAAYEGWLEGVELLLKLGAKVSEHNNSASAQQHAIVSAAQGAYYYNAFKA